MKLSAKAWLAIFVLQLAYGLVIFTATRAYYNTDDAVRDGAASATAPSASALGALRPFSGASPGPPAAPGDVDRVLARGDEHFARQQYAHAASAYAQALTLAPNNAEVYNNLGLALHYLGRSPEALDRLRQGTAVDPGYQRIWLTLGFVQASTGETEQAKATLKRAIDMDPGSPVAAEAKRIMDTL